MAANTNLGLIVSTTEEQTVAFDMARRRPNAALRSREHLTLDEVERLIAAAKEGRWRHRDATIAPGPLAADRLALGSGRLLNSQHLRPARQEGRPPLLTASSVTSRPSSSTASAAAHLPPPASR